MNKEELFTPHEERMLILAPTRRDAQICCETLSGAGITAVSCENLRELCLQLEAGASAALLTEEAFSADEMPLLRWLQAQPPWSDFPLLFVTRNSSESAAALRAMDLFGHVMLLERPLRKTVLVSSARVALRERRRQYETRHHLEIINEARQKAEDANRAKSDFLANMSHEIRTPMTVFMGAVDHLLQSDHTPEHRTLLKMAEQSANHLMSLINDILDLSMIEARLNKFEKTTFELRQNLHNAISLFTISAKQKGLRLESDLASNLPERVVGDPDKLRQVLINLIGNALKFTSEGEIRVSVKARGDLLEFAVADTGIGIPEDKQQLLFQSFTQADSSFHRKYGGSGLGLAISKGLIDLMGGEISVMSREGKGSVFHFTLPLEIPLNSLNKTVTATSPEESALKKNAARILLAEDDLMIQKMLKMVLAREGWQLEIAKTGKEAVETWQGGNFALILMDLQMPEMDGIQATRAIRNRETDQEKRVWIFGLTAHARPEIRDDCLRAGMDDVLTKPVQIRDLYQAIDRCLIGN